jgi:Domain of unknown function (DUF1906)
MTGGEVLDYSAGWPRSLSWTEPDGSKHTAIGTVRYVGTPGRPKNLTAPEVAYRAQHGTDQAFVYEAGAGWMLGGRTVGEDAAIAAHNDLTKLGQPYRVIYFACDIDVTDAGQLAAVDACLDGAAQVIGRSMVGIYGEADVIDHCMANGRAAFGWQTRAWSGGRVSPRACLLQQVGYVYPAGVQCDKSTILRDDWGQWPLGDEMPLTDADAKVLWDHGVPNPASGVVQSAAQRLLDANDDSAVKAVGVQVAGLSADLAAVSAKVDALVTSGVPVTVDYAALAKAVNDDAAARLAQ